MSSTTVHSKNKTKATGSIIYVTEKTIEIPEDAIKLDQVILLDESGSMEIQAGNSKVNEDGTLEMENGITIAMVNPKVFQALKAVKNNREDLKVKAENKGKVTQIENEI